MVCSDQKSSVLFKPCNHMCVCSNCATVMKKCVKCRAQIESMVSLNVCYGNNALISKVSNENLDSENKENNLNVKLLTNNTNCNMLNKDVININVNNTASGFMNNGNRDTSNDVQKLQQQLQDIKDQVFLFIKNIIYIIKGKLLKTFL